MTIAERTTRNLIDRAHEAIAAEGILGYAFAVLDARPLSETLTIRAECLDCGQVDIDETDMDVRDYITETASGHDRVCDAKDGAG